MTRTIHLAAALALALLLPAPSPSPPSLCPDSTDPTAAGATATGAPDLYCIELIPAAGAREAGGTVALTWVPSPFVVSVSPEGHPLFRPIATLRGLPDPASLGPYGAYVAWAAPLTLEPVVKLGEVGNGTTELREVAFGKFVVLVTAEPSAEVPERTGPLVLRGRSPSSRLEVHDRLAQAPAAYGAPAAPDGGAGERARDWTLPPPYPGVPMLPGFRALRPRTATLLPRASREEASQRAGAPEAAPPETAPPEADRGPAVIELPDGGTLDLTAGFVRRTVAGRTFDMLAFNGQHPGPLLKVGQGSTIFVNFTNRTPFPTTVHWHGVRLENRFDGVPDVTQEPVPPGGSFRYRVHFPDAGLYWYHPHHREDVQQELGLYGNLRVVSPRPDHYGPANREEVLMLDDLLLGEDGPVPFGEGSATHMLMGRFGNVFLVNGEPGYRLEVDRGSVVRFLLTNASNTRTFNLSFLPETEGAQEGARAAPARPTGGDAPEPLPVKVVASDGGRFERETRVRNVVLAPAERYVVEVRFPEAGRYALLNRVKGIDHLRGVFVSEETRLGTVRAGPEPARPDLAASHRRLREHREVVEEMDRYRARFDDPPERELVLTLEVDSLPVAVRQSMLYERLYFLPVEWTGTMPVMNWASTGREVRWILRDPETGRENLAIDWRHRVGEVVKIRIRNDRDAFHAMQHPLHVHGQRFLVLEQNGTVNRNLVWKDTVLLPAGSTTDILLELSNPGRWMVHCHIAEHLESGMKFILDVESET